MTTTRTSLFLDASLSAFASSVVKTLSNAFNTSVHCNVIVLTPSSSVTPIVLNAVAVVMLMFQ